MYTVQKPGRADRSIDNYWELIRWASSNLDQIGCNENDTYVVHVKNGHWINDEEFVLLKEAKIYRRDIILRDEYDRIIQLDVIRDAVAKYDPKKDPKERYPWYARRKVFEFRREPVPYTAKRSYHWRSAGRINLSYIRNQQEYLEEDSRLRSRLRGIVSDYWFGHTSWRDHGWKSHGKKRKSWDR